jgi:restriction endonuclease
MAYDVAVLDTVVLFVSPCSVAEIKDSMFTMELREIEKTKIVCLRKFFDEINRNYQFKECKI